MSSASEFELHKRISPKCDQVYIHKDKGHICTGDLNIIVYLGCEQCPIVFIYDCLTEPYMTQP